MPTASETKTDILGSRSNKNKRKVPKSIVSTKYSKARKPASHYLEVARTNNKTKDSIRTKSVDKLKDEEVQGDTPSLEGVAKDKWNATASYQSA